MARSKRNKYPYPQIDGSTLFYKADPARRKEVVDGCVSTDMGKIINLVGVPDVELPITRGILIAAGKNSFIVRAVKIEGSGRKQKRSLCDFTIPAHLVLMHYTEQDIDPADEYNKELAKRMEAASLIYKAQS